MKQMEQEKSKKKRGLWFSENVVPKPHGTRSNWASWHQ